MFSSIINRKVFHITPIDVAWVNCLTLWCNVRLFPVVTLQINEWKYWNVQAVNQEISKNNEERGTELLSI